MTELQELPIPNPSFTSIRQLNQLYVDKTSLIYELARFNSRQYFLARPRRFGKSLLISTLESLFRDGLKKCSMGSRLKSSGRTEEPTRS